MKNQNSEKNTEITRSSKTITLLISLIVHALFLLCLTYYAKEKSKETVTQKEPIKVRIVKKPQVDEPWREKTIVEAPLAPTETPEKYDYLAEKDHKAKKEQKVKKNFTPAKA